MAGPAIKVEIETRGLAELGDPARIKRAELAMVQAALTVVTAEAKAQAPGGRTKHLGSFLDHASGVGHVKAVFPLTMVITGAKAHDISVRVGGRRGRPVKLRRFKTESGVIETRQRGNFQALRFTIGGFPYFRRTVSIPTIPPNPFMARAAASADRPAAEAADRALQSIFNEIR
jgi:hypothetical protein